MHAWSDKSGTFPGLFNNIRDSFEQQGLRLVALSYTAYLNPCINYKSISGARIAVMLHVYEQSNAEVAVFNIYP